MKLLGMLPVVLPVALAAMACALQNDDGTGDNAVVSAVFVKPTSDVAISHVVGVGSTSALYADVDDGTSFASADDSTTYVRGDTAYADGSHTAGYSSAPSGTVSEVDVYYRAQRGSADGTAQVLLYDGTTLIAKGAVHTLGSWADYKDSFTGLSITDPKNLRTKMMLHRTSSSGALRYTEIWLGLVYATASGTDAGTDSSDAGSSSTSGQVTLPLEVIGPSGYVESATFNVSDPTGIDGLYVQGDRLAYSDNLSAKTTAKASVRLNGGAWIDLTNATANVYQPEKSYGGIGGGFHSVRLTIPITGARAGANTLDFRFNGTDGITSGYRVLAFNLLKSGTPVLPSSTFGQDDPSTWTEPNPSGVANGKTLWGSENVLTDANGNPIHASCADCHTTDGRDLKYFNYSNWSILQRSMFHHLSASQGNDIASYIRSLATPAPASARPWNPPYQPGPGLDSKPVSEWSAGAGLSAVLAKDGDMLSSLLPSNTTWAQLANTKATLDAREVPIAIQLPEWNNWLPLVHPLDIWGSYWTSSSTGIANAEYLSLRSSLPGLAASVSSTIPSTLGKFDIEVRVFIGAGRTDTTGGGEWRTQTGTTVNLIPSSIGREKGKFSLAQWMAVKHWELVQQNGLEAINGKILPETRGWPSLWQSTWAPAPHMTADNKTNFTVQSALVGQYWSSAWYQLQMLLNPGQRQRNNTEPVDWKYHFTHMQDLATLSGQPQALRYVEAMIKAYEARDNGAGPSNDGWQLRYLHPSQIFADANGNTSFFDVLNTYQPGLRVQVLEGMLNAYMDLMQSPEFALSSWPRRSPTDFSTSDEWYALEYATFVPTAYSGSGQVFPEPNYVHADSFYRLIPRLKAAGVSSTTVGRIVAWCKVAWPNGAWSSL